VGLIYGACAGSGSYDKADPLMHAQSDDGYAVGALSLAIGLVGGEVWFVCGRADCVDVVRR
jgi:hypothetical protein